MKGRVVDLAVGVIIGGAFGKIVDSMVNDLIMPIIGRILGKVDFTDLFIPLSDIPPGAWTVTVYTGGKRLYKDVDVKGGVTEVTIG